MNNYYIEAKSRKELRDLALRIRERFGLKDCLYIPIEYLMENIMPKIFDNFNYEIIEDTELPPNKGAEIVIVKGFGTVRIKESVYEGACAGNGVDRMTITHEVIGHFIPICRLGFRLYRTFGNEELEVYRDPEWQAKCLAGEFMMPYHLVKDFTEEQIVKKCGVSKSAANYQKEKFREEKKILRGE